MFWISFQLHQIASATAGVDRNDDLVEVELSGCNIKTFWRFPKTTRCPERHCHEIFADYTATLQHFRSTHAKNVFYCDLCMVPLTVTELYKLQKHFNDKHPDYKPSNVFGKNSTSTSTSRSSGGRARKLKTVCKCIFRIESNQNKN